MEIQNEHLLANYFKSGINLFLGAGFSISAFDKNKKPLPAGSALKDELLSYFKLDSLSNLSLSQISTILESEKKDHFYQFLRDRFTVSSFNELYKNICELKIRSIFTTNIDDLIYKIYTNDPNYYVNDLTIRGPSHNDKSAIDFIPLHGTVAHTEDRLVFADLDIASAFSTDPDKWFFLTSRLQYLPTLFWGYGLNDAGVLQALSPSSMQGRPQKEKWIVLREKDDPAIQFFRALDFNIIISSTLELLDYIKLYKSVDRQSKPTDIILGNTYDLFPNYAIPDLSKIPVRPIMSFYMGAAPTWSDIFSGKLHKTEHYIKIKDSIYSGKNTAVVGLPACGKTTLMMQLANDIDYDGHKLVTSGITTEQADLILRKLGDHPAIVFIDNVADDFDVIEKLYMAPNIKFVAFERFYLFELIQHKIKKRDTNIIDITDLSEKDMQAIYSKIPEKLKSATFKLPKMSGDTSPCVFEIINSNIEGSSLKTRFSSVLNQLRANSPDLHMLFLMCCYVHSCRCPVSWEMIFAFLRKSISSYQEVYEKIEALGAFLVDYTDNIVDAEQDYFLPRSSFVAETILETSSPEDLKKLILQFYKEISPLRIARYDVFRRKAFDANLMKDVFVNWEEGENFYRLASERDESAFLKQQAALYLSRKRRFKEAFAWIDEALVQSSYKIPSIRNSHAIILFRANISSPHSKTAQTSLKQSMEILTECYKSDLRKTYHALVFADHSIQYWNVFGNNAAKDYLKTSLEWLGEEIRESPWNRNANRMYNIVNKLVQKI